MQQAGVYKVPATINGQVLKLFIVDSGASDVMVPEEVFLTLFPETVDLGDMLPGAIYQLADGRAVAGDRFRIRSLTVGTQTFENVPASVGPAGSPLLLGQGVLKRVGSWSVDNVRGVLILGETGAGGPASLPPIAPRLSRPSVAGGPPAEILSLPSGLPFAVGTSRQEIRGRLGQPSFEKDRGFWANTTIDMFYNVLPGRLSLSYLYDTRTLRVRQAEATVPPGAGIDYLSAVIARMAGRSAGSSVQRAVVAVGEQGAHQAEFKLGSIEGTIERQGEARIYLAVWEPGTHRR